MNGPRSIRAAGPRGSRYSIRVASLLTSIELETLRIWERRYDFPRPERTSSGVRTYSEGDIDRLKLIRRALDHGYRAGEVVGKPRAELLRLVVPEAPSTPGAVASAEVASLVDALRRDDLPAVRAELRRAAVLHGPRAFLVDVVHPLCVTVGELWSSGALDVRHEHILSACLSAQVRVLSSAYDERPDAPRVLLASLPGESHGLGLEVIALYLSIQHVTPILLGVETPVEQIDAAARAHAVHAVGLRVASSADDMVVARVRELRLALPRQVALWIGGGGAAGPAGDASDGRRVSTWDALDEAIASLASRASATARARARALAVARPSR